MLLSLAIVFQIPEFNELNFACIDSAPCSPIRPQPARCVDTHSNMWSLRICILSVLPIPVKYLSKRQKKLLMASPIRNERNSSKALHYINTKVLYSTCVVYFTVTVIQRMAFREFQQDGAEFHINAIRFCF